MEAHTSSSMQRKRLRNITKLLEHPQNITPDHIPDLVMDICSSGAFHYFNILCRVPVAVRTRYVLDIITNLASMNDSILKTLIPSVYWLVREWNETAAYTLHNCRLLAKLCSVSNSSTRSYIVYILTYVVSLNVEAYTDTLFVNRYIETFVLPPEYIRDCAPFLHKVLLYGTERQKKYMLQFPTLLHFMPSMVPGTSCRTVQYVPPVGHVVFNVPLKFILSNIASPYDRYTTYTVFRNMMGPTLTLPEAVTLMLSIPNCVNIMCCDIIRETHNIVGVADLIMVLSEYTDVHEIILCCAEHDLFYPLLTDIVVGTFFHLVNDCLLRYCLKNPDIASKIASSENAADVFARYDPQVLFDAVSNGSYTAQKMWRSITLTPHPIAVPVAEPIAVRTSEPVAESVAELNPVAVGVSEPVTVAEPIADSVTKVIVTEYSSQEPQGSGVPVRRSARIAAKRKFEACRYL